jgi:hypothetical protein
MTPLKTKLVIGMGHKARSGKDSAAMCIVSERGTTHNIAVIALADALRKEVNDTCDGLIATGIVHTQQEALAYMCQTWNVAFDPHAVVDAVYKHGKQRALLQAIGSGRRDQEADYWITRWVDAVHASTADVILMPDMRHVNEMELVKKMNGVTVKFTRLGFAGLSPEHAAHISETALDNADFDYHVVVKDGQLPWLRSQALHLFDYLAR